MDGEKVAFDYFYGQQSEQFSFYKIPKLLCTDERFDDLSSEAKLLYGILLDRMSLSAKNGWLDEKGRVYIIFTIEQIMEAMHCADNKATKLLAELEHKAGLIDRKRLGQGKPNLIYVKNFISETGLTPEKCSGERLQNRENHDSGFVKTTIPEAPKSRCNNTDINKTEYSDTDLISSKEVNDEVRQRKSMEKYFREVLSFDSLLQEYPMEQDTLEGILLLLVDTCCTNRQQIRIAGDVKPAETVKSVLMKLNGEHIRFVLKCLSENTTRIRDPKQYLLAALYNAPATMSVYFQSWVNHDMASGLV